MAWVVWNRSLRAPEPWPPPQQPRRDPSAWTPYVPSEFARHERNIFRDFDIQCAVPRAYGFGFFSAHE